MFRKMIATGALLTALALPGLAMANETGTVGGATAGVIGGAIVGGPIGAVVGGVGGAVIGNSMTNHHGYYYRHARHHVSAAPAPDYGRGPY
jgi:uncharacterized membrane protein